MRSRRWAATAGLLCLFASSFSPSRAEPYTPFSDAEVVDTLSGAGDSSARTLRRLQAALRRAPTLLDLAVDVAERYVVLGLSRADPRYDGRAEAALAPWINLADPPRPVRFLRAILRQRVHDFDAALADLDVLIEADPSYLRARLTRATIHQVRGEYPEALKDCAALGHETDPIRTICSASVHGLTGQAALGAKEIGGVLGSGAIGGDRQAEFWAQTILAEMQSRRGLPAEAEQAFHRALELGPSDPYLLGAYADYLLDAGKLQDVVALLDHQTRIDPLLLRLALAERRLHAPGFEDHVKDLVERFAASRRRGETAHRREEGRFVLDLLDRPEEAFGLATENWNVQREPADVELLYRSALAVKSPEGRALVRDWIARTGLEDVALGETP